MTFVSLITRYANGTIFVNIRHLVRFWIATMLALAAFALIAFASYMGDHAAPDEDVKGYFKWAVIAAVLVGMASAMGEATFLGYCNSFPKNVVGFVSSGTGCAGLTGTGGLLIMQGAGLSNEVIFMVASPTLLIYIGAALWLNS
jgi:hypothetical protein